MKTIQEPKQLNSENRVENKVRPQNKHLKPHKKGENGGAHRPKGQRNYSTIRREALIRIAKENGKTDQEIEDMLVAKGLSEALKGHYQFYKDDLDRLHGKAKEIIELQGEISLKIDI